MGRLYLSGAKFGSKSKDFLMIRCILYVPEKMYIPLIQVLFLFLLCTHVETLEKPIHLTRLGVSGKKY